MGIIAWGNSWAAAAWEEVLKPRFGRIVAIKKVKEQHSERFKQEGVLATGQ